MEEIRLQIGAVGPPAAHLERGAFSCSTDRDLVALASYYILVRIL